LAEEDRRKKSEEERMKTIIFDCGIINKKLEAKS